VVNERLFKDRILQVGDLSLEGLWSGTTWGVPRIPKICMLYPSNMLTVQVYIVLIKKIFSPYPPTNPHTHTHTWTLLSRWLDICGLNLGMTCSHSEIVSLKNYFGKQLCRGGRGNDPSFQDCLQSAVVIILKDHWNWIVSRETAGGREN